MKNKTTVFIIVAVIIIGGMALWQQLQLQNENREDTGAFSASIRGLSEARQSETVELKDGDTYDLTARIVKKEIGNAEVKMLAYNGMIPGPLLKVPQGAEITLNFKNETDVPTTIHSHGIRLDNQFDGVPDVTQKEVGVGESFSYTIKFPDAGIYWYHPHIREDYAQELGLYGNYLVTPTNEEYWNPVNREAALFLDDILIEDGKVSPFYKNSANYTLMGRFGNVMLVNGLPAAQSLAQAGETDYSFSAKKGEVVRFYITNAANVRPFRFAITGVKTKLVGGDSGAYEKEEWTDAVLLGPSERAIVEVLFEKAGTYAIENRTPDKTYKIGTVSVSDESVAPSYADSFGALKTHDEVVKSIDPFRAYFSKEPDKRIKLSINLTGGMESMMSGGHMMPDGTMMGGSMMMSESSGGIEWEDDMTMMNVVSDTSNIAWKIIDEETGEKNMDIDWKFKVGDKVKIRITNAANSAHPMQHPIHFHGQRFLVIDRNGVEQTNLAWKDTVLIPSGEYIDILLDVSNPGEWMAHCHIAEHLEAGMMFGFKVE